MNHYEHSQLLDRKRFLAGLLELACQELELPDSKWQAAKTAYQSVGEWLKDCPTLEGHDPVIAPQGSAAHGTTVRPVGREEFDIDLVCHLRDANDTLPHDGVKKMVGDRLKAYSRGPKCSEYKRCWRLDYAKDSQMHLDITPAVNHTTSRFRNLAVPDREAKCWQETNPFEYAAVFAKIAALMPQLSREIVESNAKVALANVQPLPDQTPIKGYLRRSVQLLKHHRNLYFEKQPELAPISIILTSLAMKSYARIVNEGRAYDNEFDVVCDVIRGMPDFIERTWEQNWLVKNDTTESENFAEKWNKNPVLATAFYKWHGVALHEFQALADAVDKVNSYTAFERITGRKVASVVRERETALVNQARSSRSLSVTPRGILTTGAGVAVAGNTFYGA